MTDFKKQLKPTSSSAIRAKAEEDDQNFSKNGDGHKLEGGINKFRFYPAHPKAKTVLEFFAKVVSHWGTIENEKGEETKRKIPNGKHHGGLTVDPIDAYIELVQNKLDGSSEKEAKKLTALTNNKTGLQGKFKWRAWADKIVNGEPVFDYLDFSKTVRDFIKKETVIDDADEAVDNDPFTHPEEGKCLIVDYNANAKQARDYYKDVRIAKNATELTNEQAEYFVTKVVPLEQMQDLKYTPKNFETALEIVKYFDEKNEINLYESDEYQEIVVKLKKEMKAKAKTSDDEEEDETPKKKKPAVDDDEEETPKKKKATAKVEEEEDEDETPAPKKKAKKTDKYDAMDRDELKAFKAENDIDSFKVVKSMSDDEIRDNLRAVMPDIDEEEEAPAKKKKVVEEEEEEEVVNTKKAKKVVDDDEEETPKKKTSAPDLNAIKDKLRG